MNSDISLPDTIAWLKQNGQFPETLRYCEHALKLLNAEASTDPASGGGQRTQRHDALNMIAVAVVVGYDYSPGDSDLDDEQPIHVRMTLGDWRRASRTVMVKKAD